MTPMKACVARKFAIVLITGFFILFGVQGAQAQTVCVSVGGILDCADASGTTATGTTGGTTVITPGPGLVGTSLTDVTAELSGTITTDTAGTPGVDLSAGNDLLLDLVGTVTTTADNSDGVILTAGGGITATVDDILTTGVGSDGLIATATGNLDITSDTIATLGDDSNGMVLTAENITVVCGEVTTAGNNSIGIIATADATLDLACGTVATTGEASDGVVLSGTDITADIGTITTEGVGSDALIATATGNLDITSDTIATLGDDSNGMVLTAENITVVCGEVTTAGNNSIGIIATADATLDLACGTVATTGEASDGVVLSGTDITADIGTITTEGIGSDALIATATGNLDITSDTIATLGDDSNGMVLTAENITVVCGEVTTAGNNSIGIIATADATLDLACGTVATTGEASDGVVVSGTDVNLDLGTVTTDGIGSDAIVATATGDLDVTSDTVVTLQDDSGGLVLSAENVTTICGTVTTTGDNSIAVDITASGTVDFSCLSVETSGDGSGGVVIIGGDGDVTVDVGEVNTGGANSPGVDVTTGDGDQDITVGPVTVTGPGSDGVSGVATGCANVNITATGPVFSADGTAILASSLCTVTVTTLPGATVVGADAGIDVTSGTGATINLGDSVSATDGPAIIAAGASVVINVSPGGSIIGRIDLTDSDDTLNNAGTFDVIGTSDFGGGFDVINNLAGGTVSSTSGDGVLANCESFINAGTITMVDGAPNDTLTICGNYTGVGAAQLAIDVGGGTGGLTADQLIILGNAGGITDVNLNLLASSAIIDPSGVMIVDARTASGAPFSLIGPTRVGLIDYSLLQQGADTFLVSNANPAIFDLTGMGALGRDLWFLSADAHHSCADSRRMQRRDASTSGIGICGLIHYSESRYGDQDESADAFGTILPYNGRFKTKGGGVQGDLSYMVNGSFVVGLTGGWEKAVLRAGQGARIRGTGYNYGLFAEFGGMEGVYGSALIKRDNYRLRADNDPFFSGVRVRGHSTGVDGAIGWRMPTGFRAMADLSAGLAYVRSRTNDFEAGLIDFEGKSSSTRGRLTGRLEWLGPIAPFVSATLFHEFNDRAGIRARSGSLEDTIYGPRQGTWVRLEGGIGGSERLAPILSLWGDIGDVKAWGVRAGLRFGPTASALPPPLVPAAAPLPPAPPPSTQTCPDGTVVLATEPCPLPPPPPPPPPPQAERG